MLALKVVVLDAELNSASNGDRFKGGHWAKMGVLGQNTGFWLVYPADIHSWTCAGSESGCAGCRIKFCVE